jgi:hypothetical protein
MRKEVRLEMLANLFVTVSVDGRRWRQLPTVAALGLATSTSRVYVLDADTGAVRFGDGVHGARPPAGARVRVRYRQGGGAAGNVAVSWEGRWPPRAFALATSLVPRCIALRSTVHRARRDGAARARS